MSVYNVPELATKARVSNSGDVYLPLIDYVHVDGLTQEEAQALIEKRLADGGFVRSPHVTIFVDEAASQGVTVIGEVAKPGIYPDVADHKLYEVFLRRAGSQRGCLAQDRDHSAEPAGTDSHRSAAKSGGRSRAGMSTSCRATRSRFRGRQLFTWSGMWAVPAACWWTTERSPCCRRWRWPGERTARRRWAAPESFAKARRG